MRPVVLLLALFLALPMPAVAQRGRDLERFDTSGLPKTPATDLERDIFTLLRVHRRGDLSDATRIHMMLAEYYKSKGDATRAEECSRLAAEAWKVSERGTAPSANAPGQSPFEHAATFEGAFTGTDDLNVTHTWEFFRDGTFSHSVTGPQSGEAPGPTEVGWYSVVGKELRIWQEQAPTVRALSFERLGTNVAIDGLTLTPRR